MYQIWYIHFKLSLQFWIDIKTFDFSFRAPQRLVYFSMNLFGLAASVWYMAEVLISGCGAFRYWLLYMICAALRRPFSVSLGGITTSDKEISLRSSSIHSAGVRERIGSSSAYPSQGENTDKFLHSTFSFTASWFYWWDFGCFTIFISDHDKNIFHLLNSRQKTFYSFMD